MSVQLSTFQSSNFSGGKQGKTSFRLKKIDLYAVFNILRLAVGTVQESSCRSGRCEMLEDRRRHLEKKWHGR